MAENWPRLRAAFEHASTLRGEERDAYLDEVFSDEDALREQVEGMLRVDEGAEQSGFLEPPTLSRVETSVLANHAGRKIGSYTIRKLIAAGGMGAVYEADQEDPARRVAFKMLRNEFASDDARRRFRDEVDLLARLKHPGIAQIFESGLLVESGQSRDLETPWFAMELVENSRSIVKYAREEELSPKQILALFRTVCDAVHHGHQRGVIHRDLKPANLLVDEGGRVKVIDFGVAKATDSDEYTHQTQAGDLVGTLLYMSPEQLAGASGEVDVRSDVYALGIVLFELLTGTPPFDIAGLPITKAGRLLIEKEAPSASSVGEVPRELDWIVTKAVVKEPERRYQSVLEFSDDLERFLEHQPVLAGPVSRVYHFRKFVRRHRVGVVATWVVLLAVALGVAGIYSGLIRAQEAEHEARRDRGLALAAEKQAQSDRLAAVESESQAQADRAIAVNAEQQAQLDRSAAIAAEQQALDDRNAALDEAAKATEVVDFLVDVLSSPDPGRDGREVLVIDVLNKAKDAYATRFATRPDVNARLASALGVVYHGLGLDTEAQVELESSLASLREEHSEPTSDKARVLRELGTVHMEVGDIERATVLFTEALEVHEALGTLGTAGAFRTRAHLGRLHLDESDPLAAQTLLEEVLVGLRETLGDEHRDTLLVMNSLAGVLHKAKRLEEAEALYVLALEGMLKVFGDEHPDVMIMRSNLTMLFHEQGRTAEAIPIMRGLLETQRRTLGEEHPETLGTVSNLGALLQLSGRLDEAAPLFEQGLDTMEGLLPATHPALQALRGNLAALERDRGNLDRAQELLLIVHATRIETLGEDHLNTLSTWFELARVARLAGEYETAFERASAGREAAYRVTGEDHSFRYEYDRELGITLTLLERFPEAEVSLLAAVASFAAASPKVPWLVAPNEWLVKLYEAWSRPEEAAKYRE